MRPVHFALCLAACLTLPALVSSPALAQRRDSQGPPEQLSIDQLPQVYGLAVADSAKHVLHLATPLGLYRVDSRGEAVRVTGLQGNVMAFAAHPTQRGHLLAGGHPGRAGSMGLLRSTDGGTRWMQISPDAAGHVGFHMLAISPADPGTVYGITNGVRVSRDGGRSWEQAGGLPGDVIDVAASAKDANTVYAATRRGLLVSRNRGADWAPIPIPPGVVSMVHVTPRGRVYAFVVGVGLLAATEPKLDWEVRSNKFLDRVLLRLAADPAQPERLYAATLTGAVVTSADAGRSWGAYEGMHLDRPETIAQGEKLFNTYCIACHGAKARGQHTTPGFDPANAPKILAPPLDDTAHGWHHSDANLAQTILEGSPREGSPMVAWKGVLSREDAERLVAYIKSLWNFRSIACQGARHMACMRH